MREFPGLLAASVMHVAACVPLLSSHLLPVELASATGHELGECAFRADSHLIRLSELTVVLLVAALSAWLVSRLCK